MNSLMIKFHIIILLDNYMKLLELFSGTGSVGKVAKDMGFEVVSLDLKNADINCDILNWDYQQYPVKHFDMIWASPPCTEYSRAKTTGVRKIAEANKIVLKTIEIIKYFQPTVFIIENPQTGLLKNQPFMDEFSYVDVDYCMYGFNYRKRTRLWNNLVYFQAKKCDRNCGKMIGNKHIETAQRLPSGTKNDWGENFTKHTQTDLYKIPEPLIYDILTGAKLGLGRSS